jgi:hypothetical protein
VLLHLLGALLLLASPDFFAAYLSALIVASTLILFVPTAKTQGISFKPIVVDLVSK